MQTLDAILTAGPFIPHGHCYLWKPGLVGLHLVSDLLTAIAYFSIPLTLLFFVRQRKDLPFHSVFLLFSAFIVACGTTHLLEVWTLWHPTYWLSGSVKAFTAGVSLMTAIELIPIIPQALALPSPSALQEINKSLEAEINERKRAEAELKVYQNQLEELVAQRTEQLAASNEQMETLLEHAQIAQALAEKARSEIQDYAERLTLALNAANMGSWDWDLATNEIFWTPIHETVFGYEPGNPKRDFVAWRQRVHPDDLERVELGIQAALTNKTEFESEYRIVLPNGELRWIDTFGRAYYDDDGKPVRMLGMILDITSRKLFEEALMHSEETTRRQLSEIEAIYATAPIGLCVLDHENRYVRINKYLAEVVNGLTVEAHIGRKVEEVLPDVGEGQHSNFYQVLATGEPLLDVEVVGATPAQPNIQRTWLVSYYPLKDERGQVVAVNLTAQEITERKRSERALTERAEELAKLNNMLAQTTNLLRQRNQELDQFAYVVSHDLKAPLRAISNLSEWIEEDLQPIIPDENKGQLALMRARVHRMEALINGLLKYSRVGRSETPTALVDMNTLLADVVDSLDPPPGFDIKIAPDMPTFMAKPILLAQVFSNLVSNAIKHHDRPTGTIEIKVSELPSFYEFSVTDDGPGIEPLYHDKVFEIFQTLKARDEQENTGVGLSIVKKIIDEGGGTITLDSLEGQGTTFRFTWPRQPAN
ncbi:ATP-binding protein [Leptolyngbya sp. AN02str]|uniref:sensor histidine kinase n=1 Tax=Leptolyngbya sp. AN02str TaxID=3423363 RepID=UPI003D316200